MNARINSVSTPKLRRPALAAAIGSEPATAAGYTGSPVDPFAIVLLVGLACLVLWVWMLGRSHHGRGLEQMGLRSARQIAEDREALEAEDLAQMLEAHNARRRRRGEADRTVADVELRVAQDVRDQQRRRDAYLADRELDELLEATNARRRARGLPERTRDDVKREFGADAAPGR
jgi:nucleotidyltransferase/DNA polymerase involved in DNA repair